MASNFTRSSRGLFTGLFIIAIGLIFLLDQEGIVSADYMFRFFWPAIFIFFGLEAAFCRESGNRRIFGIVMTAIGVLLLVSKFGFLHIHIGFELIWPVALIWAGVWTIVHAFGRAEGRGPFVAGSAHFSLACIRAAWTLRNRSSISLLSLEASRGASRRRISKVAA